MATIDLMDQFSNLGSGGIRNDGTLNAEVIFPPALSTMRTDFIQVTAGDSIVYKNMNGMASTWNILSFYTGDAQGYYVSGIAGQTTPQSGVWTAQQDGYVRLFGSFPAGDNISVTMTDLAPDVEDYLAQYNAMNYRFLPNSIPKIVAHIQEYLSNHPIADSTTLQAVIDAAFQSYMEEIQQTADTYIAEAVPPAAAAAVDAAASPALQEITAKAAEAAESARQAGLSQQSAEMSEENALTYRNQAQQIKDSITAEVAASVQAAQEQATLAQESAQAADQSADTAEQYVAQARAQAEAAAAQAQTASGYASDAQGYMQNASDFADNAAQSAATFSTDPTLTISGKAADAKATGDQLSELKSALNAISDTKESENLCDTTKNIQGFIQSNGTISVEGSYVNYQTSDFVPVIGGENYNFTAFNKQGSKATDRKSINFFDENKNLIRYAYINQANASVIQCTAPINAKYARMSTYKNRNFVFVKGQTEPSEYIPYFDAYIELTARLGEIPLDQVMKYGESGILGDKKWVACGDSFTNYTNKTYADGLFAGKNVTYPRIISERCNMNLVETFMLDGRTLAFPAVPGSFTNSLTCPTADCYYQNIPEDADYITFYIGINDEHHQTGGGDGEDPTGLIELGTIDDNTTATYYGAWNVVLTWLLTNRPNAHIGIIVTNGLSIERYRTAQIEIAEKYGIPYIDMNGNERTPAMIRSVNPNVSSAVKVINIQKWAVDPTGSGGSVNMHPNWQAHEYESTFIENFLRSI